MESISPNKGNMQVYRNHINGKSPEMQQVCERWAKGGSDWETGAQKIISEYVDVRLLTCSELHTRMKKAYGIDEMYKKLPLDEKCDIIMKSAKLNANKIAAVYGGCVGGGAFIGVITGGIVGAFTLNPFGVAACSGMGAATGVGVGAGVGTSICFANNYWYDKDTVEFGVKNSGHYDEHMKCLTGEHYSVFIKFLENYLEFIPEDNLKGIENFLCPITYSVPKEPVFSPHDVFRHHVYERAAIAKHLSNVETSIARAVASGSSPAYIASLRQSADPMRGPYFTADQLVFDIGHAHKTIKFLHEVQKSIPNVDNAALDPRISYALAALIVHYRSAYQASSDKVVNALMRDMLAIGIEPLDVLELGKVFRDHNWKAGDYDSKENEKISEVSIANL